MRVTRLPLVLAAATLFLALGSTPASGTIDGLQMVGIGIPPDSLSQDAREDNPCEYKTSVDTLGFVYRTSGLFQIDADIQLFVSTSLVDSTEVTGDEMMLFLGTLDSDLDNNLDVLETDLELLFNYLSDTGEYDDGFEVFPYCGAAPDTVPLTERDHIDLYLVKYDWHGQLDSNVGQYTSAFTDTLEDHLVGPCPPPCATYHYNSFQVTDGLNGQSGNATGDAVYWPVAAAQAACHEFSHMLWRSNSYPYLIWPGAAFDEFFASVGGYVAKHAEGPIPSGDAPYGKSLSRVFWGPRCWTHAPLSLLEEEDREAGYKTRALWVAYVVERLRHPTDYTRDAAYRWARYREALYGDEKFLRDMCGLARVLDDDDFDWLGGSGEHPGEYRVRKAFHDFGVAKWVDARDVPDTLCVDYWFGGDFHPTTSLGLFRKLDTVTQTSALNCWELAVPPEFYVSSGNDSVWKHVPGNAVDPASGCIDGWNDPVDTEFCDNTYCDPVKVRLWGTDYISFRADTTYYSQPDDRYLRIKVDWDPGAMHEDTELWASVVKYPSARDTLPLFRVGDEVESIATQQFGPADSTFTVDVHGFHEGGSEAVTLVLTVVTTDFSLEPQECFQQQTSCMRRFYPDSMKDLEYSYSFAVLEVEDPGQGGCPFVGVLLDEEYVSDNNVLAGAVFGTDETDYYRLEHEPSVVEGTYRLRLSEDEEELSHFDSVQLLAVDKPAGFDVCVLPGNRIGAYSRGAGPLSCVAADGTDLLPFVSSTDGEMATIPAESWVDVSFPPLGRGGGGAGGRGGPGHKIDPPGGRGSDLPGANSVDLTRLCYRGNTCTSIFPLPDGNPPQGEPWTVRLHAPVDFYLDDLFTYELADWTPAVTDCRLLSAQHGDSGDCLQALVAADGEHISLAPGQQVDLFFAVPAIGEGLERDFVLVTSGHYDRISERAIPEESPAPVGVSAATAFPSPFTSSTTVRFEIPSPGGSASVSVFNLSGRLIKELGSEDLTPGVYELEWDGRDSEGDRVPAGVYFFRIEAPGLEERRKVVMIR